MSAPITSIARPRVAPSPPRRDVTPPTFAKRLRWIAVVFLLIVACLIARLVQIQILQGPKYATMSEKQVRKTVETPALRGAIYDRYGQILAVSRPTALVVADDFQITHPVREAKALARYLGTKASLLLPKLEEKSGYVVLTNSLDVVDGKKVSNQYFPGIDVMSGSQRSEPNGSLAAAVLGGVNSSGKGYAGIEYQYQHLLAGTSGEERVFVSPSGIDLPNSKTVVVRQAKSGEGLELTLDTGLQFVTEQALGEQLVATKALSGVAIVMDVKTGEILADASLVNTSVKPGVLGPIATYGQSIGIKGIDETANNLAVTEAYEPGSVFKVVTFSAALQNGLISPSSVFTVPYSTKVSNRVFHDAEYHPLESLTATQILAQSSNIGTYEIANEVGETDLLAQVQRLGFGEPSGLNFPGEGTGFLVNAADWYPSDLAALPIGQVDAVTPIQVLDAYNAIANRGVFVAPKLVRAVVQANGKVVKTAPSVTHDVFSSSVDAELNQMLQKVVSVGTGTAAIIPGYTVAGKTGTAQIPTPNVASYITGAYNASFVGFAPAQKPVLSMLVIVEKPQTTIYGGSVAAPVFQRVMSYALHHYGIPTSKTVQKVDTGATASISSDVT